MALKSMPSKRSRRSRCGARRGYYVEQTLRGVRYGRIVCWHPHRRTLESLGRVAIDSKTTADYDSPIDCISQGAIADVRKKWKCPESREGRKMRLAREQMAEIRKQAKLEEMVFRGNSVK